MKKAQQRKEQYEMKKLAWDDKSKSLSGKYKDNKQFVYLCRGLDWLSIVWDVVERKSSTGFKFNKEIK